VHFGVARSRHLVEPREQQVLHLLGRRGRHGVGDERRGAIQEHAGRLAGGVPADFAAHRRLRRAGDLQGVERGAVHPDAEAVQ
jgi:hypothetical protein